MAGKWMLRRRRLHYPIQPPGHHAIRTRVTFRLGFMVTRNALITGTMSHPSAINPRVPPRAGRGVVRGAKKSVRVEFCMAGALF